MKKLFSIMLLLATLMISSTSCSSDKDEPDIPNQTINVGGKFTIPADGTWESSNNFIASVDGKIVKGNCAGECSINNGKKSFNVTVTPTLYLYKDPCLLFGASESSVRSFMKGFEDPVAYDNSMAYYYLEGEMLAMYVYTFENKGLKSTSVSIPVKSVSAKALVDYLTERYIPVDVSNELAAMVSPDKKIAVGATVTSYKGIYMYFIFYTSFESTKSNEENIVNTISEKLHQKSITPIQNPFDSVLTN